MKGNRSYSLVMYDWGCSFPWLVWVEQNRSSFNKLASIIVPIISYIILYLSIFSLCQVFICSLITIINLEIKIIMALWMTKDVAFLIFMVKPPSLNFCTIKANWNVSTYIFFFSFFWPMLQIIYIFKKKLKY